jgi:hypothetical protein
MLRGTEHNQTVISSLCTSSLEGAATRIFDKKKRYSVSEHTNHVPRFDISVVFGSLVKTVCSF